MAEHFTIALKSRFSKLLLLAAESPYEGERQAALDAAERIATRCGLDIEEAARLCRYAEEDSAPQQETRSSYDPQETERAQRFYDAFHRAHDPRAAAASRARQRALWEEERRRKQAEQAARAKRASKRQNSRRIPPIDFARTLILETGFTLKEIGEITGVQEHELVILKLKLRPYLGVMSR